MFIHNLKFALRNITKNKQYAAISVLGLTIGFTAFILMSLFLKYENNWDTHNVNYNRIFRVQEKVTITGKEEIWTQTHGAVAELISGKYPEIENIVVLRETWGQYLSSTKCKQFFEENGYFAEPSIFNVFTYHFVEGSGITALKEPNSIVLSQSLAHKFFPNESALGKTILLEKKHNLKVTGVYTDLPRNSHIRPVYLLPFSSFETIANWKDYRQSYSVSFRTYVLLKIGTNYNALNNKIGDTFKSIESQKNIKIYLHPLSMLYLKPVEKNDYNEAIYLYMIIAVFILLLTCSNFINMSTAVASLRSKEIVFKKIVGGNRMSLIIQLLTESMSIAIIALLLSFLLTFIPTPLFSRVVDRDLIFNISENWRFIGKLTLITLFVGLLSGIYPALYLTSGTTFHLLKAKVNSSYGKLFSMRKVLISVQFIISLVLILLSVIVFEQIEYMKNKKLGFDKQNLLIVKIPTAQAEVSINSITDKLLQHPEIEKMCVSNVSPFSGRGGWLTNWEGCLPDEKVLISDYWVNSSFITTMKMKIVHGRDFSNQYPSDAGRACIINETAMRRFGWKDPIGKTLTNGNLVVVGVVADFHPFSVNEKIPPVLIIKYSGSTENYWRFIFRAAPGKLVVAKQIITKELEARFPNDAFEIKVYNDLISEDETIKVYTSVQKTIMFFSLLNILLAVIGLIGLISFTIQRKTKEVAIRKING